MCEVYRNSRLCLSASGASNASEGLYFDRSIGNIGPLPLCPTFQDYDWRQDAQYPSDYSWHLVYRRFWPLLSTTTMTFPRAWIFPERFLSGRILHFGRKQLFWECGEENYCETFPTGLPRSLMASADVLTKPLFERIRKKSPSQAVDHPLILNLKGRSDAAHMQMIWETLVADYTRCTLSNPNDKLVALSGMAQHVWLDWKKRIGGEIRYIAGMWDTHLPNALLWWTSSCIARPSIYRAPTWSWSSIEGKIHFQTHHWHHAYECTSTVLGVHISYVKSSWGQVKDGHIWIRGPVRKIVWSNHDAWSDYALHREDQRLPFKDEPSEYGIKIESDVSPGWRTELLGDLYALLVMRFHDPSVKGHCVVLLHPVDGQRDTFHRVGVMAPMSGKEVDDWFGGVAQRAVKII